MDRFSGSLVVCGDVAGVEAAFRGVLDTLGQALHFTLSEVTRS